MHAIHACMTTRTVGGPDGGGGGELLGVGGAVAGLNEQHWTIRDGMMIDIRPWDGWVGGM